RCRPSQINDLLKSLTVIDRGSGRAVSVSLPLDHNTTRILNQLPKQVRNASGLLDVLRVFRGARVSIEGRHGTITGRVVGVEEGLLGTTKDKAIRGWRVTLKTDKGALAIYPVSDVKRLVMRDRALEVGLDKSLDVSLEEGTWKPITLAVRLTGGPSHDLLVTYIVEMPNWKPAYRLVLPEGRKPLLQGWAVVDNISGEAWHQTKLSLVAGTPMSFLYNLHAPRFSRRIDLTPRGRTASLAPPRATTGYGDSPLADKESAPKSAKSTLQRHYAKKRRSRSRRGSGSGRYKRSRPKPSMRPPSRSRRAERDSSKRGAMNLLLEKQVEKRVQGKKLGGLFRYDLQDPVTVPDNSSTLVNIINARVSGNEVVLFRPELTRSYGAAYPYRAVRFMNDSGFALEKGPVAIYAKGTFVGEGFLERMEKGQTIFLTYAIDRNVTLSRSNTFASEPLRLLKIHGGRIITEVLNIYRYHYELSNQHDKPIVAYVKSAKRSGYKLRNAPKRTVNAPSAAFVPVTIPAKKKAKLTIEWVNPVRRYLSIDSSLAITTLKMYLGSGSVPAAVRPTLSKIIAARAKINDLSVEISRLARLRSELRTEQDRVRKNLDLLRKVRGNGRLRAKVTKNLGKLSDQLAKLTGQYVKADQERSQRRRQMRALIGTITLDNTTKK
ncbi:MAG: hypothetical protein KAI47_28085, partial [Deltaproteobacteria bacterium]|nr:hypothetical protein [Deltaproteobacteria bacterium]